MRNLALIILLLATPVGAQTVRDGITIPSGRPRYYWNAAREAQAVAWAAVVGYTPITATNRPLDPEDASMSCGVLSNATACTNLVSWMVNWNFPANSGSNCSAGLGCDSMRHDCQQMFLAYDVANSSLTVGQLSTINSNWDTWITAQDNNSAGWGLYGNNGHPSMPGSNYFAGDTRCEISYGIAVMGDNTTAANTHLDHGLGTSGGAYNSSFWNNLKNYNAGSTTQIDYDGFDIHSLGYANPGSEGFGEYGRYVLSYHAMMLNALSLLGRSLETEDTFSYAGVYMTIYNTVYDTSYRGAFEYFPSSDDEDYVNGGPTNSCKTNNPSLQSHNGYANGSSYTAGSGGCLMQVEYFGDFMQAAVNEFPTANAGKLARAWLNKVQPSVSPIYASLDANPTPLAMSTLPLDYGTALGYLWSRDNWNDLSAGTATQCLFQGNLGEPGVGHFHQDAGNFECYRHGIPIIRETVDYYTNSVAGYADSGTVASDLGLAHNVGLVNGVGSSATSYASNGLGVLLRRESQTGYSFEAVNLQPVYNGGGSHPNSEVSTYVREFIEFRGIPALVIVDRWTAVHTNDTTTFLTHCLALPTENTGGTYYTDTCITNGQEAFYTSLVPAHPSQTIVHESDNSATTQNPQYRIESNNTPGVALSYQIMAIQFGDSSGFSALTPSVVDSNSGDPTSGTFTITLDANNSLVINKGATSSGGTIKAAGVSNSLTSTVEAMTVSASGPVWANSQATPGPSGVNAGWLP